VYPNGYTCSSLSAQAKYGCAIVLAMFAHAENHLSVTLEGYSTAISLISQVAWFGRSVVSRQIALTKAPANFASNAAACVISQGLLERAMGLLDHG
jgi:hypothetical protein